MSDRTMTYDESRKEPGERDFVAPYVVVGLECSRPLAGSARYSAAEVDRITLGRGETRSARRVGGVGRGDLFIELPDSWMSSNHVCIRRDGERWEIADAESKNGTFVNGVKIERQQLEDGDLIEVGNTVLLWREKVRRTFSEPLDVEVGPGEQIATLSIPLARQLADLRKIAGAPVSVLIGGESGTGKEVTARALHELSGRGGELVAINCGALAPSLIESELFGHKKGAFSGASEDRPGLVREAHGGTLFLDEIAELPESSQVKLLRVLQEKEVIPVGASKPVAVDLRVVSATHQNLAARVDDGRFRQDLFARLAGFQLELPPLRERREDLGLLIARLLGRILGDYAEGIRFQRSAGRALFQYDWPLNVRELEQALTAAAALADEGTINVSHLPASIRGGSDRTRHRSMAKEDEQLRAQLVDLLRAHQGNISAVARELGKARIQVRRWCKKLGIDAKKYR